MTKQESSTATALAVAYTLARGCYQAALISGHESLSGARLRGKAKDYFGRYRASGQALLSRLQSVGCGQETRGDHNRRNLDIEWTRETTLDDIVRASAETRALLIERYESGGADFKMDEWVQKELRAIRLRQSWIDTDDSYSSPLEDTRAHSEMREHWGYRISTSAGQRRYSSPVSYLPYGDDRDVTELEAIQHDDWMRRIWWRDCRGNLFSTADPTITLQCGPWTYRVDGITRGYTPYGDDRDGKIFNREHNQERRAMIWRICGIRLVESGMIKMTLVHSDDFGTLYRTGNAYVVKVVNATPELDGSYKDYFLRVPPYLQTARQAVAWTFGMNEQEYAPAMQS